MRRDMTGTTDFSSEEGDVLPDAPQLAALAVAAAGASGIFAASRRPSHRPELF